MEYLPTIIKNVRLESRGREGGGEEGRKNGIKEGGEGGGDWKRC